MAKIKFRDYLHGDKAGESWMFSELQKLNLSEEVAYDAASWSYEIAFDLEVDTDTGEVEILKVQGRTLLPKESNG